MKFCCHRRREQRSLGVSESASESCSVVSCTLTDQYSAAEKEEDQEGGVGGAGKQPPQINMRNADE